MRALDKFLAKYNKGIFALVRLLIGFLFFVHGAQKFGFFGGQAAPAFSMFWMGGLIEVVAGAALFFGFLTRLTAFLSAIYILVVYFVFHAPNMVLPTAQGGGELALLYFAAFLHMSIHGPGKFSIDAYLRKRK